VAAATTGVEGLKAIIPVSPNTSYYRYYRSNGLVRSPGGYLGEDTDVLYSFIDSGSPARRETCDRTIRDGELVPGEDRATGDYNDFWRNRDFMQRLGGIKAATFLAHGLNDWNVMPEHSIRVFEALEKRGVPTAMYLHQGGHGGPPPMELMNEWFTHFLYGVDNGIDRGPKVWIEREGAAGGQLTAYPDYPAAGTVEVTLHPTPGGVRTGGLALTPAGSQGTGTGGKETLVDNFSFDGATLAKAEWTDHRLIYATPELTDPVRISGTPRVTIRMAANKPAANLSVWLVSLPYTEGSRRAPDPYESLITRGWADPQNHASLEKGEPLVPGGFYDVTFDLQPDDQIVPKGKRIALMILSTDREFTVWPEPGTEITVDLGGTSLTLPVVGGLRF
jgi:X-Pro dipeptidyl-peptidase